MFPTLRDGQVVHVRVGVEPSLGLALGDGVGLLSVDLRGTGGKGKNQGSLIITHYLCPPSNPSLITFSIKIGSPSFNTASRPTTVSRKSKGEETEGESEA